MKIVYVSTSILPSRNANSVHVMKMCSAFKSYCEDVCLIGIDGKKPNLDLYEFYNVKNKFSIVLTSRKNIVRRLFDMAKHVKSADLVYTRWYIGAFVCSFFLRKKVIMEYHSYPYNFVGKLMIRFNKNNKNMVRIVFITESLRDYFICKKAISEEQKTIVLPDGSDVMKEYSEKEIFQICYVGSFLPGKGVDTVVQIANAMPDYIFHIIGGDESEIEKYKKVSIHDNLIWHGFLCQRDIEQVISDCSVALLPNKPKVLVDGNKNIGDWTSPLKMFEYMAQSKAIVASDLKILREILKDKYNAVLVDPDNIQQWVDAICLLENDKNLLQFISTNAYNDILLKYSWDRRAEQIIRSIENENEIQC